MAARAVRIGRVVFRVARGAAGRYRPRDAIGVTRRAGYRRVLVVVEADLPSSRPAPDAEPHGHGDRSGGRPARVARLAAAVHHGGGVVTLHAAALGAGRDRAVGRVEGVTIRAGDAGVRGVVEPRLDLLRRRMRFPQVDVQSHQTDGHVRLRHRAHGGGDAGGRSSRPNGGLLPTRAGDVRVAGGAVLPLDQERVRPMASHAVAGHVGRQAPMERRQRVRPGVAGGAGA